MVLLDRFSLLLQSVDTDRVDTDRLYRLEIAQLITDIAAENAGLDAQLDMMYVPDSIETTHQLMLTGCEHEAAVFTYFVNGLTLADADLIGKGGEELELAIEFMDRAITEFEQAFEDEGVDISW